MAAVQMVAITAGVLAVRSIKLTLFDPVLATTAMPVAGLMATSLGDVPIPFVDVKSSILLIDEPLL